MVAPPKCFVGYMGDETVENTLDGRPMSRPLSAHGHAPVEEYGRAVVRQKCP